MGFFDIFLVAIGLSMDAFAVSISKGISSRKYCIKNSFSCGLWFGFFQTLMPFIGCIIGAGFSEYIKNIDHWIAFALLCLIGLNMIKGFFIDKNEVTCTGYKAKEMFLLATATSIDALAVGITFAFLNVHILKALIIIGFVTFFVCAFGVKIGNIFGERFSKYAEALGGSVLVIIGVKILTQHIFFA